jgi:FkbM family methyltransferase
MAALTSDRVKIFLGRARNGISNRLRDAYRILILKDEIAIAQRDWFKQRADFTLRLDYPLGPSSVVLDLGGYQGDWAAEISKRYDPVIHIFEPIESFAEGIRSRFQGNEKVFAHSFGLAAENTHTEICVSRDASSTFVSQGSTKNAIELRDIAAVLKALNVDRVDLIKINIEGGEYSVLRRLIDAGLISRCNNIQVQFHEFVKDAKALRLAIRSDLSRTHDLTYDFPFVWENWRLRDR